MCSVYLPHDKVQECYAALQAYRQGFDADCNDLMSGYDG